MTARERDPYRYDPDQDDGEVEDDTAGLLDDGDSRPLHRPPPAEVEKPRRQRMKKGWRR